MGPPRQTWSVGEDSTRSLTLPLLTVPQPESPVLPARTDAVDSSDAPSSNDVNPQSTEFDPRR
jgi:hypothetical protein